MIDRLLPAYCYSKRRLKICGIIIHYFSAINVEPSMPFDMEVCRNLFVDLNRPRPEREHYLKKPSDPKVRMYASAHILLGRNGEEYRLVPFDRQAYHAGDSVLNGRRYCNRFTLGIELAGLTPEIIIGYVDQRRAAEVLSDTIRKEIGTLSHVLKVSRALWGIRLPENPVAIAKEILSVTRTLRPGNKRIRRLKPGAD